MASGLQIYDPVERWLVRAADWGLAPLALGRRLAREPDRPIRRVLLLRLERIGDLLMVLDAIRTARQVWPEAEIDLAVGSWNRAIAELLPDVTHVLLADAPWLARGGAASWPTLLGAARQWRATRYDVVVNFEPDVRSNFVAWLTRAPRRLGYWTGGGGAFLTEADAYDPTSHVAANAVRLIARAAGVGLGGTVAPSMGPALPIPEAAARHADALLAGRQRPFVGVHASGGRESKQWHLDRVATVARTLATECGATIILTGGPADRPLVATLAAALTDLPVVDASGTRDLLDLAALLQKLDLFVTGDTGPMHLAATMGTPLVALFGPSDPRRYGPLGERQHVVRIDLPCSPCGRVRLPPARCRGHVPDCMDGISAMTVVRAAKDLLAAHEPAPA